MGHTPNSIERFVFIVTYGRSGSTLLNKLIGSAKGFHMAGENNNALFGLYKSFKDVESAKRRFGLQYTAQDNPWYCADLLGPERYARRLVRLFVEEIINPPVNTRVAGFKEIRYFENEEVFESYLNFIKHFFNPVQFVFNSRNAEDISRSGWWKDRPVEIVEKKIAKYDKMMDDYYEKNINICYKIRYEDYNKNTDNIIKLMRFLKTDLSENKIEEILSTKLNH